MTPKQRGRAVGYVRVSQVGGREGDSFLSPDVQREKIEAWASYRGFELVGWYIDLDRPAKAGDVRPEFERMLADAKAGKFEAVAVYRLTRFARSVGDAARHYAELREAGVDLASVTEDFDTSTASGKLVQNMLFALAEFESQRIGEEWRNVHANRRRRGIAHVARPMFGYQVEKAAIVAVEPAEAEAVRELFKRRLRGEGYGALQAWLEREGFRPKGGKSRFAKATIRDMLTNPLYVGLLRDNGELVEARHEGIVSRETFEAVQALSSRVNRDARFRAALLSGLVVCSGCGYRMRFERRRDGQPRYRCIAHTLSEPCPAPVTISAPPLEEWVEQCFLARFDPKRMPHGGKIKRTRVQRDRTAKAAKLRARADQLTGRLDRLADLVADGKLDPDEYERQARRYVEERAQAHEKADSLDAEAVAATVPLEVDALSLWPTLDLAKKRQGLRLVVEAVRVHRGRGAPSNRATISWRS